MYSIVIVGGRAEEAWGTREDYGGEQQKNRGSSEEIGKLSIELNLKRRLTNLTLGWGKIGHGWRTTIDGRRKAENEEGAWKTC